MSWSYTPIILDLMGAQLAEHGRATMVAKREMKTIESRLSGQDVLTRADRDMLYDQLIQRLHERAPDLVDLMRGEGK